MIEVNDKGVRIEGSMEDLIGDWAFITKDLYKETVRAGGMKNASKLFMDILKKAAGAAVIELKAEGKLPEEGDTE